MDDGVDGLREIDDHRTAAPPEDVEGGEVAVHQVRLEHPPDLRLKLAPDPARGVDVQTDVREPRSCALAVADEGHAIPTGGPFDGRRDADARRVAAHHGIPFVPDPACVQMFLAEAGSLLHRAVLVACPLAPDAGVEVIVPEGAL